MKHSPSNPHLTLREVVLFGMLAALTFALQVVMGPLPNIEPVSLLVILFAVTFGWKSLYVIYTFVAMEILYYGLSTWCIYYLYVWTVLALVAILLRKVKEPVLWAVISGAYGLLFGVLCAIADVFMGGVGFAVSKWVSGVWFDILHCVGNFVIALVLFKPLHSLLSRLYQRMRR
ncbi:MAG: hypothetical protein E7438_07275 [Ruminococcaceae bacterium]|nr:hypothetical protein [Oscillospiraceae bacterium]